jgi:hypothetical protein
VMALSWAGHGKLPEVWKNPHHKDRQHHSQPTLPSCHYNPCGPTHHLSPTHSTLVIIFLSPTLCHTHPPSSSHSTFCPHTILLPTHSSVHPSLSTCTTTPYVPPSAPSTAQCHSLTASLFPTLTYSLLQVHHPGCFMQMRVGGSIKTQLS